MDDDKKLETIKECLRFINQAQDIIQCPICMEVKDNLVMCTTGHHICQSCRRQLGNCPTCLKPFSETKCYIAQDVSKILNNIKTSMVKLEQAHANPDDKKSKYRDLIKTLLTKLSTHLNKSTSTLTFLGKYLQNPNNQDHKELERQLISLTSSLHNVKYLMNVTKANLTALKK